jgi:uncharacterized protein with PIN domain
LILDSSAVVAVLFREQGHRQFAEAMDGADVLGIGAPTLLETDMADEPLLFVGDDFARTDLIPALA